MPTSSSQPATTDGRRQASAEGMWDIIEAGQGNMDNDQIFRQNGVQEYFFCNVLLVSYNDVTISKWISLTGNVKQNNQVKLHNGET